MALRLFFTSYSIVNDSIESLQSFVKDEKNLNFSIFEIPKDSKAVDAEKGKLKALISLVASSKMFNLTQHLSILKSHPRFQDLNEPQMVFIELFIQRMCQISDLNFHGIFGSSAIESDDENATQVYKNLQRSIGTGAFLFNSLLNHSCTNNILRVCQNNKIITVVCKPIAEGGQIFDCYK